MNEALVAFDLNTGILDALASLVVDSKETGGVTQTSPKIYKYNTDKTYAFISVAVLVTAGLINLIVQYFHPFQIYTNLDGLKVYHLACLAHFALVLGGFSGAKEQWQLLPSLFSSSS